MPGAPNEGGPHSHRRWLPHIHTGSNSTECISDEAEGGREGRYIDICWLGFMLSISWSSVFANRRYIARIMGERS